MPRRQLKSDTYYHIYNRGNNKQRIFFNEKGLERFGTTITRYLLEFPKIRLHVWSFLQNHFHFLLSEEISGSEPGFEKEASIQISHFMNRVQQAYARYFSIKYAESRIKSPVFEGRFKAKEITDENYLSHVAFYIRHNAVKHEIVEKTEDWKWAGVMLGMNMIGVDADFEPGFE